MSKISKYITKIPLLSFLIVIGLGFAQFHEAIHAAETVQLHTESDSGESSSEQHEDVCLSCTLSLTALSAGEQRVSFDNLFSENLYLPHLLFAYNSATTHFRLRAPPSY
ncbi:hypothetical protein DYD21_11975 [Rhodohalobacter sp. SW132]|uniref:hypothetical protein n=1 Tax=Rhodohalobacter sp. SW132 TaxID=2293433 RepID=UPI000E221DFE|nr:hypothetical protein [Rhodohalobacter sp. SW132]REL33479.1 hypothetical protein DYD21_11975 [Rhodohalobacter sp. SW132]